MFISYFKCTKCNTYHQVEKAHILRKLICPKCLTNEEFVVVNLYKVRYVKDTKKIESNYNSIW